MGLRRLVLDVGPSRQKLLHDHSHEVHALTHAAQPPPDWSLDDKVIAVQNLIYDAVDEMTTPRGVVAPAP